MKRIIQLILLVFLNIQAFGQLVGADAYLRGNYINIGISGNYGHEGLYTITSPVPAGYVYRGSINLYGMYANSQMDGWVNYEGDFVATGSPENGWGFEIVDTSSTSIKASNNCASTHEMSGSLVSYTVDPITNGKTLTGTYPYSLSGYDIDFEITYNLMPNDLYYTTMVKVTNNGATTIPELYYYRNLDPDNNQTIGGGFTTKNTIISQPTSTSNKACVMAQQFVPWTTCIALVGQDENFRVSKGGFTNRSGSQIWNATGSLMVATVGSTSTADEAISMAYQITNLAPGASQAFEFYTVFEASLVYETLGYARFDYVGAGNIVHYTNHDTVNACGDLAINITGAHVNDYNWTWSPNTYLDTDTGMVVHCAPSDTITYMVIGTPMGAGVPDTLYTTVIPGTSPQIAITNPSPLCNSFALDSLVYADLNGVYNIASYTTNWPTNGFDNLSLFVGTTITPSDTLYLMLTDSLTGCYDVDPLNLIWNDVLFDFSYTPTACTGATATASVTGISDPVGSYTVLWSTGDTTLTVSGLDTGMVSVLVTGVGGCTTADSTTIVQNTFNFELSAQPEYCNLVNGNVVVGSISNADASYSYLWSTGSTDTALTNVDAGTYSLTMTNANGCLYSDTAIVVDSLVTITLTSEVFDATCGSCSNGSIYLTPSGTGPFTYSWGTGATSQNIFGLLPGTYFVTVTDMNGCSQSDTFLVNYSIGVNEIEHVIHVNIYPVPVTEKLIVEASALISHYALMDAAGKMVFTENKNQTRFEIDFTAYAKGVYNLMLYSNGSVTNKRIIK